MRKAPKLADSETLNARKRNMRNQPTKAEYKIWGMIKDKQLGVKFLREEKIQHVRDDVGYYVDFVCYERAFIVEVDNPTNIERAKDEERNQYFIDGGYDVLRFRDKEIMGNPNAVLNKIKSMI